MERGVLMAGMQTKPFLPLKYFSSCTIFPLVSTFSIPETGYVVTDLFVLIITCNRPLEP